MSKSIVFVFQSENGSYEIDDTIHQPKKDEFMTFNNAMAATCKLDGKIKVKHSVHLLSSVGTVRAFLAAYFGACL